jgi:hypothetical protein
VGADSPSWQLNCYSDICVYFFLSFFLSSCLLACLDVCVSKVSVLFAKPGTYYKQYCHNYETNLPKGTKKPLLKAPFQPQNSLITLPPSLQMHDSYSDKNFRTATSSSSNSRPGS